MKGRARRVDTKAKRLQNNPETAGYFGIPEDESWLQRGVCQRGRQDLRGEPANCMTTRSERHHEVPQWLLKYFCWDYGNMLWMGFKDTREIRPVSLRDAFVRKDANTRTDYQSRGDGTFQQVKSDLDETILANFDGQASSAARELIDFSRQLLDRSTRN